MRESLEAAARARGVVDRVLFLGFRREVQSVLDALDVFVLPSLCETLGYALLEAMAAEVAAIGTTVGGIPEVIVPGETGFLVPPRDPVALAGAIRDLLANEQDRRRMGEAGRRRVAAFFDEKTMVSRTIDLYRMMLRTRAGDK